MFTVPILGGEFDPMGLPNTGTLVSRFPVSTVADSSFADALLFGAISGDRPRKYLVDLDRLTSVHP